MNKKMLGMYDKLTTLTENTKTDETVDIYAEGYWSKSKYDQNRSDSRWSSGRKKEWDEPDEADYAKKDQERKAFNDRIRATGKTAAEIDQYFSDKNIKPAQTNASGSNSYKKSDWETYFKDHETQGGSKPSTPAKAEPAPNKFAINAVKKKWDTLDDEKKKEYIAKYGAKNLGVNESEEHQDPIRGDIDDAYDQLKTSIVAYIENRKKNHSKDGNWSEFVKSLEDIENAFKDLQTHVAETEDSDEVPENIKLFFQNY